MINQARAQNAQSKNEMTKAWIGAGAQLGGAALGAGVMV
jgi:hypothetical protein